MTTRHIGSRSLMLCAFALVGALSVAGPAAAISPTLAANKANKMGELATLHAAKKLLVSADHDYKGHRAKAVHEVTEAIHELEYHHKAAGTTGVKHAAATGSTTPRVHANGGGQQHAKLREPQANSDQQLQAAMALLQKAAAGLNSGNHPKALGHVNAAIESLQLALKTI